MWAGEYFNILCRNVLQRFGFPERKQEKGCQCMMKSFTYYLTWIMTMMALWEIWTICRVVNPSKSNLRLKNHWCYKTPALASWSQYILLVFREHAKKSERLKRFRGPLACSSFQWRPFQVWKNAQPTFSLNRFPLVAQRIFATPSMITSWRKTAPLY